MRHNLNKLEHFFNFTKTLKIACQQKVTKKKDLLIL